MNEIISEILNVNGTKPGTVGQMNEQGMAEGGIATPGWPDDGNHTSNNPPVSIGGVSMKQLSVGDQVKYFGNKATVVGLSQDRKRARIHMPERHETQTIDTADLTRLGQGIFTRVQPGPAPAPVAPTVAPPASATKLPLPPGRAIPNPLLNKALTPSIAGSHGADSLHKFQDELDRMKRKMPRI